uniref:Uncharacterized protein n=1 Tax=Oryza sativa subsp. japonica TaxID=39947 RepID=Q69JU8_ORYSJ|nr:hypothetical protein [Oryza sativa Japonica Group]
MAAEKMREGPRERGGEGRRAFSTTTIAATASLRRPPLPPPHQHWLLPRRAPLEEEKISIGAWRERGRAPPDKEEKGRRKEDGEAMTPFKKTT